MWKGGCVFTHRRGGVLACASCCMNGRFDNVGVVLSGSPLEAEASAPSGMLGALGRGSIIRGESAGRQKAAGTERREVRPGSQGG